MLAPFESLRNRVPKDSSLIVCAGFEDRVTAASERLASAKFTFERVLIATYSDQKNQASEKSLRSAVAALCTNPDAVLVEGFEDSEQYESVVLQLAKNSSHVFCDISGFNTGGIFSTLSLLLKSSTPFTILYTEAETYYPTQADMQPITSYSDDLDGLKALEAYEGSERLYSRSCVPGYIENFEGNFSPGYPFFLIAFLAFKRSRLGAILQELAASKRVLIAGSPPRIDLAWRSEAIRAINSDLIQTNSDEVIDLDTLCPETTLRELRRIYLEDDNRYRYNFVVAPLGSKMQKVACWMFGIFHPNVAMLSASPTKIFDDKYSVGSGETFVAHDVHLKFGSNI